MTQKTNINIGEIPSFDGGWNAGCYYNSDKYTEAQARDLRQWAIFAGDSPRCPIEECEEIPVAARDKREASEVGWAAIRRDYDTDALTHIAKIELV